MEEVNGKRLAPEKSESVPGAREAGGLYEDIANTRPVEPARLWVGALFFSLCIPWLEVLLRLSDREVAFFSLGLPRSILAGCAMGLILWLIGTLIPRKIPARWLAGVLLFGITVLFIIQRCCRAFFGTYFQLAFMADMTGQVAGDFMDTVLMVAGQNALFFPLAFVPLILFAIFSKAILPQREGKWRLLPLWQLIAIIAVQAAAVLLCHVGGDISYYTYDFAANTAVPRFGLVHTLRLEGQYALLGMPEMELPAIEPLPPADEPPVDEPPVDEPPVDEPPVDEPPADDPEPIVYDDNVMEIDFDALIANSSGTLKNMHTYFSTLEPTAQNEYTGLFAGKNLILITAESFSTAVIDPERTPTLYRLANTGFVFENFYQPDWSMSTTGGEFAVMNGIIPTWVNGKTATTASIGKEMPFALGNQFSQLGYTVKAYHNNSYTYYNRHKTHPNLGYDYMGVGNGLTLENPKDWPCSDVEMMEATVGALVEDYLTTGTPFHAYYMTVSGHCNYSFGGENDMSDKHRDVVEGMEASKTVRAYLACQMELEYALTYLVNALEEAGIADDTVIALATDHYPYAMSEDSGTDYYVELTGVNDTPNDTSRYRNTLILWSGCMEEPVVVDAVCTAVDIVPTLSNLFGLEYDSRLLSGRDILSPDVPAGEVSGGMKIAVFADFGYGYSWVTAAGRYEAYQHTFYPNEGVEVSEDYVEQVKKLVSDRFTYAKYLIGQNYYAHLFGG